MAGLLVFLLVFWFSGRWRVHQINLAKSDGVELVTKMTQETQSFLNLAEADPRGGAAEVPRTPQADRTEIAPGGPSEVAEPPCAAHLRCAVHHAPLQEIAETVSRALAYLTDRLIWPYCLPAKAEQCLKLHEEIERAHEVYQPTPQTPSFLTSTTITWFGCLGTVCLTSGTIPP